MLILFSAEPPLSIRLAAMCAAMSSKRGVVLFFLASLLFDVRRPCVTPDVCSTTAYRAAETPRLLASAKTCNFISLIGSLYGAKVLGTVKL